MWSVRRSRVSGGGIDRFCSDRVDAESDGGCTGRGGPSDRGVPKILATAPATLDAQLVTLYASLPARTAVVIFTGHSDLRRMASLNAHKVAFESEIKSGKKAKKFERSEWWTASDGVGGGGRKGQARVVVFGDQVDLGVQIVYYCPRTSGMSIDTLARAKHRSTLVRLAHSHTRTACPDHDIRPTGNVSTLQDVEMENIVIRTLH